MKRSFSFFAYSGIGLLLIGCGLLAFEYREPSHEAIPSGGIEATSSKPEREDVIPQEGVALQPSGVSAQEAVVDKHVQERNVPFSVQAPDGRWNDPIFQNGCEEASVLMAARAGDDTAISLESARLEIITIAGLSERLFGTSVDTSAEDTLRLFQAYTGRSDGSIMDPATDKAMRETLMAGNILIVPMDGRALRNPHFTAPGPKTHMLVVIGYDPDSREYITHDPGTRFGAGYRYGASRFLDAIRDYPTGDHLAIESVAKRAIVLGNDAARP